MELHVRLVMGSNRTGKCWKVVHADPPHRVYIVPKFAVLGDCRPGDEWVVLDVMGFIAVEIERAEWTANMKQEASRQ